MEILPLMRTSILEGLKRFVDHFIIIREVLESAGSKQRMFTKRDRCLSDVGTAPVYWKSRAVFKVSYGPALLAYVIVEDLVN